MGEKRSHHPPASKPDGDPGSLPPDYTTRSPSGNKREKKKKKRQADPVRRILEYIGIIIAAIVLAYVLQAFLIKPFKIPSSSMEPTLVPGDRVLVNRLAYKLGDIERGEIIVFRSPEDGSVDFIKRVIAVGGDTVEVRNGEVIVNGVPQEEPYVQYTDSTSFRANMVPEGYVFVMGDNRPDSQDSRRWQSPWLPEENIIGKAFMIYWPLSRIGGMG